MQIALIIKATNTYVVWFEVVVYIAYWMNLFQESQQLYANLVDCLERKVFPIYHLIKLKSVTKSLLNHIWFVPIESFRYQFRKILKLFLIQHFQYFTLIFMHIQISVNFEHNGSFFVLGVISTCVDLAEWTFS